MSLLVMAAKPALALTAPVLSYDTVTQTSVHLTWTDAGNEQQYRVYKNSVLLITLGANVLSYTATGLTPATTYAFRVDAKKGGQILPSNTVTVTTQSPPPPECSDGIDNDGDTFIDYPADPGCTSASDTTESPNPPPPVECNDGIDNDGDTLIDYPADPGCTSATDTTESPNPPPPTCTGVDVPYSATVGYLNTIIPGNGAQTYCLAAGQYEMGTASLSFDSGDSIIGPSVSFGPKGEVYAQAFIRSSSGNGVIAAGSGDVSLTVENLDLSGAGGGHYGAGWTDRADGINGNFETTIYLTVRNSRIHDNANDGIGHIGRGMVVENSEIDNNGSGHDGYDAGIKTVHYAVVHNTYFHHNWNGFWWDCDAPGGEITGSRFEAQERSGVYVEISAGDDSPRPVDPGQTRGFRILSNTLDGNNTGNNGFHAGVLVISSRSVLIDGNTATNNLHADIRVDNDSRQFNGHAGCSSGFTVNNVTVSNNQYGPLPLLGTSLPGTTWTNNTKIL
jgi:hypothetical protein